MEARPGRVVIVDCPGGMLVPALAHPDQLDVLVVVVEPYPRAAEAARRLLAMVNAKGGATRTVVVANKIHGDVDLDALRRFLPGVGINYAIAFDPAVVEADANGAAPMDVAPDGPVVRAVRELAGAVLSAHPMA